MGKIKTATGILKKLQLDKEQILSDYQLAVESREAGLIGRKEVFMGRAKFGIFGGGKEVAQIALAKFFREGDWRSGYYRDQTLMFALGDYTIKQLFAQLYAHPDHEKEPVSGGRLMTGHFGTRSLNEDGTWKNLSKQKNSTVDISPTAAQMPRLVGLAYASKLFRENKELDMPSFSVNGNEVAFGTIGNASTSEGIFFESINAAGVLQVPMLISVWDDEYGISVPSDLQTTKGDISKVLAGFQRNENEKGYEIFRVRGWDYPALLETYEKAVKICREEHVPVMVHVVEMTQPGGHSTSGSHERYKSKERIEWEEEYDCIKKMGEWIVNEEIATLEDLEEINKKARANIKVYKNEAYKEFHESIKKDLQDAVRLLDEVLENTNKVHEVNELKSKLLSNQQILRSDVVRTVKHVLRLIMNEDTPERKKMVAWHERMRQLNHIRYSSMLYSSSDKAAVYVKPVPAKYKPNSPLVDGRQVLQACFDDILKRDPRVFAFGEDVGKLGDVNQGFEGLQEKYGDLRVTDTGIRECTIMGQAIGAAFRGLRPIAEIQYLDYLLYALQIMSDDLATIQYRSFGRQKAPVIVRTRGHRLEGVWHSGSPTSMVLSALRGVYVCVPRNMTQAAGFYNTLLASDDSGLVIECLNGYRLKEKMPSNIGEFKLALGIPEILKTGDDVTIVTYGAMCRIVLDAAQQLEEYNISVEVIDVQTLLPFDVNHTIVESLKKTNRVLFADEDVPGGTTAYMMQHVLEFQNGYYYLDSRPKTINSWAHRPAYATDGDYFSKPNAEDVFDYVYDMMAEVDPANYPKIYRN